MVHKPVGALGPFERYVRSALNLGRHKSLVQPYAFLGHNTLNHFNSGLAQHVHTSSGHKWIGVRRTHHHPAYTDVGQQLGAWWCLAIVRAWLQRNIDCGLRQECAVSLAHRGHCIHLGMRATVTAVIAFADNPPAGGNYCAHHRVGRHKAEPVSCKLQGPAHIGFIYRFERHSWE